MSIKFSSQLIEYLAVYLGKSLSEFYADLNTNYSKIYIYKVSDGSIPVNETLSSALNDFWTERELSASDLENIYSLIDNVNFGIQKEKQYQLKKHRGGTHK